MAITAEMVKQLREKTGAGMMDCKRALEETGGDFEKAANLLRQKGVAVAAKREAKATTEGTIGMYADGKTGVIVEVGCETDFVARTDDFQKLARELAAQAASGSFSEGAELVNQPYAGDASRTVQDAVNEVMGRLGEKIVVKRHARLRADAGAVGVYVHTGGKIGVLAELGCGSEAAARNEEFQNLARDIAMQIAWGSPQYITRAEVPADQIDQEKEIHRQWAIKEGNPEAAIDRIVAGRMERFYSEVVLLDQPFIRDSNITIGDLLKDVSGRLGEKIEIRRFVRYRVGEQG